MDNKSLVIGDGGWGMAIAMSLYRAGRRVHVWGFEPPRPRVAKFQN